MTDMQNRDRVPLEYQPVDYDPFNTDPPNVPRMMDGPTANIAPRTTELSDWSKTG
jgi:hypothetical protein